MSPVPNVASRRPLGVLLIARVTTGLDLPNGKCRSVVFGYLVLSKAYHSTPCIILIYHASMVGSPACFVGNCKLSALANFLW